jgi:hypothetical protein
MVSLAQMAIMGALLLAGCECMMDGTPPGVRQHGASAQGADRVLAVATGKCGRDLRGDVTWLPAEPLDCGGVPASGCGGPGGCHLSVRVARLEPATSSALAHEIGHYCLDTADEDLAQGFANEVNMEALH